MENENKTLVFITSYLQNEVTLLKLKLENMNKFIRRMNSRTYMLEGARKSSNIRFNYQSANK